jgi:DNA-binding transcriptional MerR regulator
MADTTSTGHLLRIGEVADRAGLSLRTVRYYEEMELVVPETRTDGGFRLYTEDHLHRLALIRRMKPLGFTLQEMRDLLEARETLRDDPADAEAKERLAAYAALGADRQADLAAKARRGGQLVELLRQESQGESPPTVPPAFFEG